MTLTATFFCGEDCMNTLGRNALPLNEVESDADFILFSEAEGLISEHCTQSEAKMAFFEEAGRHELGDYLPRIYRRDEPGWVPLSWS
jgi:hypothetical protein